MRSRVHNVLGGIHFQRVSSTLSCSSSWFSAKATSFKASHTRSLSAISLSTVSRHTAYRTLAPLTYPATSRATLPSSSPSISIQTRPSSSFWKAHNAMSSGEPPSTPNEVRKYLQQSHDRIFENNKKWAADQKAKHPEFFDKLAQGQSPDYLWIGTLFYLVIMLLSQYILSREDEIRVAA